MVPTITPVRAIQKGSWKTIVIIGLIAGTLDAVAAIVVYKANPGSMFRFIASGAFGAGRAFSENGMMVLWGVLFHYVIALSWTALFFLSYPTNRLLRRNKYLIGVLYGIFVWIIMNKVILPLSAIPQQPFDLVKALIGAAILVVAIGLPISILTHRFYFRKGLV
jgi:hypothetical protein